MPPKRKNTNKAKKSKKALPQNNELAQITRMLKELNVKPQNQVTDLGRMLLKGGNLAGSMFGFPKIFGSGSYQMSNSLWSATQQVPIMHSSNESIRLKHREYIGDVSMAGAAFTTTQYAINPGLANLFPFLSSVADNFQEYSFRGLVFEYKSTSATALVSGTNTAMGAVMLAAQYRADAPAFSNKTQLLNEMWSVDTVPSQNIVLPIECSPAETPIHQQYVRTGSVTGDQKLYDLATLTVATSGGQAGQTNIVGELWVSYDIELFKPQVPSSITASGSAAYYGVAASWTNTNLFGGLLPSVASTIGITVNSSNTISFPQGSGGYVLLLITCYASGTYSGGALILNNIHVASSSIVANSYQTGSQANGTVGGVYLITAPSNQIATVQLPSTIFPTGSGILDILAVSLPYIPALWGS